MKNHRHHAIVLCCNVKKKNEMVSVQCFITLCHEQHGRAVIISPIYCVYACLYIVPYRAISADLLFHRNGHDSRGHSNTPLSGVGVFSSHSVSPQNHLIYELIILIGTCFFFMVSEFMLRISDMRWCFMNRCFANRKSHEFSSNTIHYKIALQSLDF